MTTAARISVVVLLVGLVLFGLLGEPAGVQVSHTSFGTVPRGYRGAYEVLAGLALPVRREVVPPSRLEPQATVWWIEPQGLCGDDVAERTLPGEPGPIGTAGWPGRAWIEAGGTAVVMLPPGGAACTAVAGLALPARIDPDLPAEEGDAARDRKPSPADRFYAETAGVEQEIDGPARVRTIRSAGLTTFAEAGDWQVRARVGALPFLLERALGRGRVVVVADAGPLRNAWLSTADGAPWMIDLVRAFGVPRFDEYSHGVRTDSGAVGFIAGSAAVWLFAGLAVLGSLVAWRGAMLPPRSAATGEAAAPVLDPFVDALADLYARSGDYRRVADRYRDLAVMRLCRRLGLPPGTSPQAVVERLGAGGDVAGAEALLATDSRHVGSERELLTLVRGFEALSKEVGG